MPNFVFDLSMLGRVMESVFHTAAAFFQGDSPARGDEWEAVEVLRAADVLSNKGREIAVGQNLRPVKDRHIERVVFPLAVTVVDFIDDLALVFPEPIGGSVDQCLHAIHVDAFVAAHLARYRTGSRREPASAGKQTEDNDQECLHDSSKWHPRTFGLPLAGVSVAHTRRSNVQAVKSLINS